MTRRLLAGTALALSLAFAGSIAPTTANAAPEVVSGPGYLPECFAPWNEDTKFFQWEAQKGRTGSPSSTASSATPGASR